MRLTYIYHSGFAIEADGFAILVDYYKDTGESPEKGFVHEELLDRAGTLYILSSHFHPDHFNPEVLRWKTDKKKIVYLFGKDILKKKRAGKEEAIYLKKGETYEDHNLQIEALGSTDSGISFLIEAGGKRLFHAGDLNNWHWKDESTPEEAAEAEKDYLKELDDLAKVTSEVDVALFPVDPRIGSDFARGAQQFVDRIKTRIFVPMHFWDRPAEAATFRSYAESRGCRYELISVPGTGIDI